MRAGRCYRRRRRPWRASSAIARPTIRPLQRPPQPRRAGAPQLDTAPHDGKTMIPEKNLAPQIIRPQVAYLLSDMMKDVIRRGSTIGRERPCRGDIAGKTGTTNDHHDAW